MSDLQIRPTVQDCGGTNDRTDVRAFERLPGRAVSLTNRLAPSASNPREGLTVERFLPTRGRRMVGAWCFVDRYGPHDVTTGEGMMIGPHPHTGLQTVTWLLDGEVVHRDSVGSLQTIVPGELNLMTAGRGISHAEESPLERPRLLHGLQLWVALPEVDRRAEPAFEHHAKLPHLELPGINATVLMGTLAGVTSPATTHTPLVGALLDVEGGGRADGAAPAWLPLKRSFEYGLLVIDGDLSVEDEPADRDELIYLGNGRDGLDLSSQGGCRVLLIGGVPFSEEIVMWWNYIGRSNDEIVAARALWNASAPQFGVVTGARAPRVPAPPMPASTLRTRGRR